MKKPILRGYYGGIFFEFILQDRKADAVVILPGFPSGNEFGDLISLFYGKGYHVFVPRYRGSHQSSGIFMSKNPVEDMAFFIEHLKSGEAKSLWDMKKETFEINKLILIGGSFSGPIACGLAAKYPVFSHLILQAPVWDFREHNAAGDEQDLEKMTEFVKNAYKNCYRFKFKSMKKKLEKFDELKPQYYIPKLNLPVLVMHDPNDRSVAYRHTKKYAAMIPTATYLEHYLGHKLLADMLSAYWKEIDKFIKINYLSDEERAKHAARQKVEERKVQEIKKFEKAVKSAEGDDIEMKVVGSEKDGA
jgi:pimeloyl-ACP methyl ester carboxylesterase